LLKGLSLKEIAAVRATTERTVRAQARSLYAKAGLTGRASLSAFFLEDLLAPIERPGE
jgi:DNA-binding NarL/FixJ family response regulator